MVFCAFCAFYAFYMHKKHLTGGKSLVCALCFFGLFVLFMLFMCVKSSCNKKIIIIIIKRFKIALIVSFTLLLTCIPLDPPIENLFVHIHFYLWESFFHVSCKNLFFFVNLLQYFAVTSKHKLKILILLEKAITVTYFLSVLIYFHLLLII